MQRCHIHDNQPILEAMMNHWTVWTYSCCSSTLLIRTKESQLYGLRVLANQYSELITVTSTNSIDEIVHMAFTNQHNIGWHSLLKGFISINWKQAQEASTSKKEKRAGANPQWAVKSIEIL